MKSIIEEVQLLGRELDEELSEIYSGSTYDIVNNLLAEVRTILIE